MLELFQISLMCAVVGYVYAEFLIAPDMLLWKPWKWVCDKWLNRSVVIDGKEVYKESWFYKPLGGCYKCFTGQLALWAYLFHGKYNIGHHAFVVCLAILISIIIFLTIQKLSRE